LSPGDGFTRPGSFSDPGTAVPTETWSMTINYGDGSGDMSSTPSPGAISLTHSYASAGQYTVTVKIRDNYMPAGTFTTLSFTVKVSTAPTLTVDHGSTAQRNQPFDITGHFPEGTATGSYSINWGDPAGDAVNNPNVQSGTVSGSSGTFMGSHKYKHTGTYTVFVTFTDANGDNITVSFAVMVS